MLVPELILRKSRLAKLLWIALFERRNISSAAAVHVTADIEATDMQRLGLRARRFAMIPNGVDLPHPGVTGVTSPLDGISRPIVLCLGRVNWKKGLDRLVRAMIQVPDARLVIAGNDEDGYAPQLLALAKNFGVGHRMHFIGPVHGAAKWRAFAGADLFVLPSRSENFGMAVLESMASGVPVIVTPEVGLAPTVLEAGAGLVIEGDSEKIGIAIAELLAEPERRRRMGESGRTIACQRFSWDVVAAEMEALYLSIRGTNSVQSASAWVPHIQ